MVNDDDKTRYPAPLRSGDLIRIVSPAGPVQSDRLRKGIGILESSGYRVETAKHALLNSGYTAGSTSERLFDLVSALTDPAVSAVICSRGGYGVVRLLEHFPWDALSEVHPKLFVGFSDITAFQIALWSRAGWISYSGPQVAALGDTVNEMSKRNLLGTLDGSSLIENSDVVELVAVKEGLWNLDCDFIPGNLAMLVSLLGTAYFPDLTGKILCIEDINEPMYRLERMLWQLESSKSVDLIEGLVLGEFLHNGMEQDVGGLVSDIFSKHEFPIWKGLPYGHGENCMTLPVGGKVPFSIH